MSTNVNTNSNITSIGLSYDKQFDHTPITRLFFSPRNIKFLHSQLEKILSAWTGSPIRVQLSNEFAITMHEVASRNKWLSYMNIEGLKLLNNMVLGHEAEVQYLSLRHKKLFEKYFITGDRMRVFPHGIPTKITKGEVKISPSGYMLTNPWKKNYKAFLNDVMDIPAGTDGTPNIKMQCQREPSKKDDLADCFLQAVSYFQPTKKIIKYRGQ